MKNSLVLIIALVLGISIDSIAQESVYEDVSKEKFAELIKSGDGLLIDLRTPKEYEGGHIEGAVNIDFYDDDFRDQIDKLDKNRTCYIYCHSGGRSGGTLKVMKEKGFKAVYHLPIGYDGWVK